MRRNGLSRFFILIGFICLLAAGGLYLWNVEESNRAGDAADAIQEKLIEELREEMEEESSSEPEDEDKPSIKPEDIIPAEEPPMESYTTMVDGYPYIGILDIPDIGISLPVMADWDYTRLRISPCRFSGTPYKNDLVICGHNYARHFSPIKWIDIGKDVYFTAMNGDRFHYVVGNRETVQPESVEEMMLNSNNSESKREWDLTLFTCNTGGQTRCAVRCLRVEESESEKDSKKPEE